MSTGQQLDIVTTDAQARVARKYAESERPTLGRAIYSAAALLIYGFASYLKDTAFGSASRIAADDELLPNTLAAPHAFRETATTEQARTSEKPEQPRGSDTGGNDHQSVPHTSASRGSLLQPLDGNSNTTFGLGRMALAPLAPHRPLPLNANDNIAPQNRATHQVADSGSVDTKALPSKPEKDGKDSDPKSRNRAPSVSGAVILDDLLVNSAIIITLADLLQHASDADADTLNVANVAASSGTIINNGDGTWTYTPDVDDTGDVTLSYVITDGQAGIQQTAMIDLIDAASKTLVGTENNDVLVGAPQDDVVYALGGDDIVRTHAGDDVVYAGPGNDIIHSGDGNDLIYAGGGNDSIFAGAGDDIVYGGEGDDIIAGEDGDDTLLGEDGDDLVSGGHGNDALFGGNGADVLAGDAERDVVSGGEDNNQKIATNSDGNGIDDDGGNDSIFAGAGDDIVYGGDGNDIITGDDGDDTLLGDDGNDAISGGNGNDALFGGNGADVLAGDADRDVISGGTENDRISATASDGNGIDDGGGNDSIFAGAGDDIVNGGEGNDIISGDDGDDTLLGEDGNDAISGGNGYDALFGGNGADILAGDADRDVVSGGEGNDQIVATNGDGNDIYDGGDGADTYDLSSLSADTTVDLKAGTSDSNESGHDDLSSIENVVCGSGNDTITANEAQNVLTGGDGDDVFIFAAASDSAPGEDERDTITDFEVGDKIDVSKMDSDTKSDGYQKFEFKGDSDHFDKAGELRYRFEDDERGSHTLVIGTVTDELGDDFVIELSGAVVLNVDDFIGLTHALTPH